MRDFNEITDKIMQVTGIRNEAAVAKALGMKPKAFYARRDREPSNFPLELLALYCEGHNLDLRQFIYKDESPINTPEQQKIQALAEKLRVIYAEGQPEDKAKIRGIIEETFDDIKGKAYRAEKTSTYKRDEGN